MDRFVDYYKIRPDKLLLVAITCLHIAAQIENTDAFIPRYSEMNRLVKNAYTAFEYKAVERKILCFLNFELIRPTTASFVELFACSFLTRSDFKNYIEMLDEYERIHHTQPYQRYISFEEMLSILAQLLLRMADYTLYSEYRIPMEGTGYHLTLIQFPDLPTIYHPFWLPPALLQFARSAGSGAGRSTSLD